MIDRILSNIFIITVILLFLLSYLEVPIVEGLTTNEINSKKKISKKKLKKKANSNSSSKENMRGSSERDLGRIEAKVDGLNEKVTDLLSVVSGQDLEKIKNYDLLDKLNKQTTENKTSINKMAANSPEADVASSV